MIIKDATPDHLLQFETIANRIVEKQNLPRVSNEEYTVHHYDTKDGSWEYIAYEGSHECIAHRGLTTGTWCVYEDMVGDTFKIQFNGITEDAFLSIPSDF
jgi:hypothetical protein|nr:MAG TPA: hypothetical protein [Caudoviricetes sp.]